MLRYTPNSTIQRTPALTDVQTEVQETQLALIEIYEGQEMLQDQITELQLAIVEQYEQREGE